jgi:Arc/MetJ-type ribon-helix-helix transcriptional regulator
MSTLSITIPDDVCAAAERAVATGRFATVSEYVAMLILYDQGVMDDVATEALLLRRMEAGPPAEATDATFDRIRQRLDAEAARRRTP